MNFFELTNKMCKEERGMIKTAMITVNMNNKEFCEKNRITQEQSDMIYNEAMARWNSFVVMMDDEIREEVRSQVKSTDNIIVFAIKYTKLHKLKYGEELYI